MAIFNNNSKIYGGIDVSASPRQQTYNERYNDYMRYKYDREKLNPFKTINDSYTQKKMTKGFTDFLDSKFPLPDIFNKYSPVTKTVEGVSRTAIPIKDMGGNAGSETAGMLGKYAKYLPYLVAAYDVFNDNPERGIGTAVGTYAGSALSGTALGAKLGTLIPIPGIGTALGALAGSLIGSAFKNKDPDKYLWADQVKKITGNNPDGWGSGGDWSEWFTRNYEGVDKGLGDHFGGRIRRKEISPTQALQELARSGFKKKAQPSVNQPIWRNGSIPIDPRSGILAIPSKATAMPLPASTPNVPVSNSPSQPLIVGGRPVGYNSMWRR